LNAWPAGLARRACYPAAPVAPAPIWAGVMQDLDRKIFQYHGRPSLPPDDHAAAAQQSRCNNIGDAGMTLPLITPANYAFYLSASRANMSYYIGTNFRRGRPMGGAITVRAGSRRTSALRVFV